MPQPAHGSKETKRDTVSEGRRNQWHVYEFIKKHYMQHGTVPTYLTIYREFSDLSLEEVNAGFDEFKKTVRWVVTE